MKTDTKLFAAKVSIYATDDQPSDDAESRTSRRMQPRLRNVESHRDQFIAAPEVPVPPEHLRARLLDDEDARHYLKQSHRMARSIYELIRSRAIAVRQDARVLDFGCGAGGITTWLHFRHSEWSLYGSDSDAESVAWAQSNLGNIARFDCNLPAPPLAYWDDYFDLVVALSAFNHPADELESSWFEELVRVTRPGGHVVVAVAGPRQNDAIGSAPGPHGDWAARYRPGHLSTDFIRHAWSRFVRIEQIVPRWLQSDRALVIGRK